MPATDSFGSNAPGLTSPATNWFAVTPNDGTDLPFKPRGIWVGGAGDLAISNGSQSVTLAGVPAGSLIPIRPERILATGTTATGIVAVY